LFLIPAHGESFQVMFHEIQTGDIFNGLGVGIGLEPFPPNQGLNPSDGGRIITGLL